MKHVDASEPGMMIQVQNLTKHYGATCAVGGISFEVERGQVVGFLGPNGAGKTTTMRILAGYMPATEGTARIAGHDVFTDSLAARRNLGYLPEGVPLYPEMRVDEYLRYRARIKQTPARERKSRIEYVIERCHLGEVRKKLIGTLSKGFRQRVGLAEALVHDPPVLILDEPTIGLDPNQIRQVRDLIRDLGRDHTILISTHILSEVEMVCDRVVIIHGGKLVFQDSLENITERRGRSGKVIVEFGGSPKGVESALSALPGVTGIRSDGNRPGVFEVSSIPDRDVREEIFTCAVTNQWVLRELRSSSPSLEDIFVRLTAKDIGS